MAVKNTAICIGDNCIDQYLPPVQRIFVGGNALNTAIYLKKGGVSTAYLGFVGKDSAGETILSKLLQAGIDISRVKILPGKTARSEIQLTSQGDRIFVHEDLGPKDKFKLTQEDISFIQQFKLVHNTWLGGSEDYLGEFKKNPYLVVSMDYGERCPEEFIYQTIPFVDIAIFSLPPEKAAMALDYARNKLRLGLKFILVTCGREGSWIVTDNTKIFQPAIPTIVVDTLGAGDSYIGTFLACWLRKKPIVECMRKAAQVAASTCTFFGAWEGAEIGQLSLKSDDMMKKYIKEFNID